MKSVLLVAFVASVSGGVALAQEGKGLSGALEARLDRIEQAIAKLDQKLSARGDSGMMEACREMMGSGMMGGGMMGRKEGMHNRSPNKQWQDAPKR